MNDHLSPEPSKPGTDPVRNDTAPEPTDLDLRSQKWRGRLAAIREGPFRVVIVACLILYTMITGMLLVPRFLNDTQPLRQRLWELLTGSLCLAGLFAAIGVVMLPMVICWRFVTRLWHRRIQQNTDRLLASADDVLRPKPKPTQAAPPTNITNRGDPQ
jgi:hypothetical protein